MFILFSKSLFDWAMFLLISFYRRGTGAFTSKVKADDKKQKYSFRETDKRLKRLARRMTGKCYKIIKKLQVSLLFLVHGVMKVLFNSSLSQVVVQ